MLQHNHNADYVPSTQKAKIWTLSSQNPKHLFLPSRVWSCCYEVEFWQKSESSVISMQIATSLKRPSTHYLGVGAGVSRREEVKKVVRGAFFYFLWSFLVFLWTCYVFRQTVRKSNSSLSSCCFYEKLCGYEETILVPGYSVSEAYEVGKTG